jgi:hypothetical protein
MLSARGWLKALSNYGAPSPLPTSCPNGPKRARGEKRQSTGPGARFAGETSIRGH